jgi:hypothetical protein
MPRAPKPVREHGVRIGGVVYPVKQAFEQGCGVPRAQFTSQTALRHLRALGFPIVTDPAIVADAMPSAAVAHPPSPARAVGGDGDADGGQPCPAGLVDPGLVTLPGEYSLISPPRIGRHLTRALAGSTTSGGGPTGDR